MNYLAHLFLAQPTPDSHFGNLLGDFRRGASLHELQPSVLNGLENHYLVDRFTDAHPNIQEAKGWFKPSHRRFAPVALDMVFDHLLIKNWDRFSATPFDPFCAQSFSLLESRLSAMPPAMQRSVSHMIKHNWFRSYAELDGINDAIKAVANRIRFTNDFAQCTDDINSHIADLNDVFTDFFPSLIEHVAVHRLETPP